jgi:hypothetical protein
VSAASGQLDRGPIETAIDAAADGLPTPDAERLRELIELGLERLASSAPATELATDIEPAAELPPDSRLAWAEAFALEPLVRRLSRRAEQMVAAFQDGSTSRAELHAEAEAILAELADVDLERLAADDRKRLQRRIGEARIEARHVLSDGEGPRSLRAGRRAHRGRGGPPLSRR